MVNRNIISGLLLFSISVLLGPYMMRVLPTEERTVAVQAELREAFGALRAAQDSLATAQDADNQTEGTIGTEEAVANLANAAARASRAHVNYYFGDFRRGNFVMTHAHGNLMGIFNIIVGLFLARLAADDRIKLAISWGFIAGSWIMVGALLLGNLFGQTWALQGMIPGGAIFILSLLALTVVFIRGSLQPATNSD